MAEVKIIGQMDNTLDHTFESANRVYDKNNLCPTLNTCGGGQLQPKVIEETRCVGGLSMSKWGTQYHQQDRVYKGDIALAQPANLPEGSYKYIVASRGRNPENTSDRKKGSPMEQRLELKKDGCTNTITTVQKDNYVLEKNECKMLGMLGDEGFEKVRRVYSTEALCQTVSTKEDRIKIAAEKSIIKVGQISSKGSEYGTVISENGISSNLVAGTHGYANNCILINQATVETVYRIRKLTPKECWRLMGYTDEDFDKASKVNSNTQLYKQAGNAIVKQVLMAIFSQLNIKGVKAWNDMTETEKRDIIKKSTMVGEFDKNNN